MSWKKVSDVDADAHSATGSAGSALRRGRRVAAASLVAVAALSLTACGSGGDDTKASTKVSSSPDPSRVADEAAALGDVANEPRAKDKSTPSRKPSAPGKTGGASGGASDDKTDRDGGTDGGKGTGGADHTGGTDSGGGSAAGSGSASQGKGVSGTWNGVLKYLAPGKMTVAPDSGPEQGFFVGSQTKSLGAAAMCASNGNVTMDESGYGTSPCTEAQLEEAAKMNSLDVRVTVEGGVATKIVEHYHP
ncbi:MULTISPECIES: hypothetical protein [Streptomyces]|uniref:hypothetical protein n=1 Tax=Streptomyces TaxID=1883 RepID=UPI002020D6F5|nr:hypothetical protein [Streptomyces sp. MCA2]MCL7490286.1 hypothetical protein [Streptomyces sp. MCA2]